MNLKKINLKEKVKNVKLQFENLFKNMPITMIAIILFTVYYLLQMEHKVFSSDLGKDVLEYLLIFGCSSFAVEGFFLNFRQQALEKTWGIQLLKKIIYTALFTVIGLVCRYVSINYDNTLPKEALIWMFYASTVIAGFFNCLSVNEKQSNNLGLSIMSILQQYLLTVFATLVAFVSYWLILELLDTLLEIDLMDTVSDFFILLGGLYTVPRLLFATITYEKVAKFFQKLNTKFLSCILLIAYGIVYVYAFKNLFSTTVVSYDGVSESFWVFTVLFSFTIFFYLVSSEDKETVIGKLINLTPYLFLPLILFQVKEVYEGISEHGLNTAQYTIILTSLFEVSSITVMKLKKVNKLHILTLVEIFLLICFECPVLNIESVCLNSQTKLFKQNIEKYEQLKKQGADNEELAELAEKINSETYDLNEYPKGKIFLENLSEEEKDIMQEVFEQERYVYNTSNQFATFKNMEDETDVRRYDSLKSFSGSKGSVTVADLKSVYFEGLGVIDLSNFYNMAQKEEDISKKLTSSQISSVGNISLNSTNNYIEISENRRLVIEEISMMYNPVEETINYISINGYLLSKD